MASFNFSATATTTAAALGSTRTIVRGVTLKAAAANTGKVHVGFNSDVTTATAATDGLELSAGEGYFVSPAEADDIAKLYIISSTSTQKLYVIGN